MSGAVKKLINIKLVSDHVCPWCYIGRKNLETAIAQTKDKFDVKVTYYPFFLDPRTPAKGVEKKEFYNAKFGPGFYESPRRKAVIQTGENVGIKFCDHGHISNTLNAHRLVNYALKQKGPEKQSEVVGLIMKAYHEEGKDQGSFEVLEEIGEKAGLDRKAVHDFLESTEGVDEVKQLVRDSVEQYDVSGVPFFVINDRIAFSGAQPPEVILGAFTKAANL